jgi:hypothetical protein
VNHQKYATLVVAVVMMAATVAGCSAGPARPASTSAAPSPPPTAVTAAVPHLRGVQVFSRTYRLSPSGPLTQPQTVRLPLIRPLPSGWAVVVATAETSGGSWRYLPATLSADRRTAIFTTDHHSIFTVIGENVSSLLGFFKTQFLDGLSSGATAEANRPSCADEATARSGYSVQSSTRPTIFWCFGIDSSGQRILRVVNNRLYPLEIQHPGLTVAERPAIDYGSLASLSHLLFEQLSILAPGAQIGYRVSLAPGQSAGAQTAVDGFGQGLFALQTGVNALLAILTRFGAGGASKGVGAMNNALGTTACADAMFAGNPGSVLASCLSPKQMAEDFGTAGVLLAPLAAAGGLADFFASEFQGLHDILTGTDTYQVIVRRTDLQNQHPTVYLPCCAVPIQDQNLAEDYRPRTWTNDVSGNFSLQNLTWQTWNGKEAIADGTAAINSCEPACAGGRYDYDPVVVTLSQPQECSQSWFWSKAVWHFPDGIPPGETQDVTRSLIEGC